MDDSKFPQYQDQYPSRYLRGTLGWVLDQESGVAAVTEARKAAIMSEFERLERAYRDGRKAACAGKDKDSNPYSGVHPARSFSCKEEWLRGWRAARMDARRAAKSSQKN